MIKRVLLIILFMILIALGASVGNDLFAQGGPVQVLNNTWAWGDGNADGCPGNITDSWTHSSGVSLSVCNKNPAPPNGDKAGSAFKNGGFQGNGQQNVPTFSRQIIDIQQSGIPVSNDYSVSFDMLLIALSPTALFSVTLEAETSPGTWQEVALLIGNPNADYWTEPDCGFLDWDVRWKRFCSPVIVVPHFDQYRLGIGTVYAGNNVGLKWVDTNLWIEPAGPPATNTPTPTPTNTPTPTPVPTATPEPVFLPIILSDVEIADITCENGTNPIVIEQGISVKVDCQ